MNGLVFRPDLTPQGTVAVGGDNAGSFTFTGWRAADAGIGALSGHILWSCTEGR